MRKALITFVVVVILAPLTVYAFSYADVLNLGKRLMNKEAGLGAEEIKKEMTAAPDQFSSYSAIRKYQNWKNAYDQNDISMLFGDKRNFNFSDSEINYLISRELAVMPNPPARGTQVSFSQNLAKISGYSMLKYFSGQFYLEVEPAKKNGHLDFKIVKAEFRKVHLPVFIAESFLKREIKDILDFLKSDPDQQELGLTIGSGFAELNYK